LTFFEELYCSLPSLEAARAAYLAFFRSVRTGLGYTDDEGMIWIDY